MFGWQDFARFKGEIAVGRGRRRSSTRRPTSRSPSSSICRQGQRRGWIPVPFEAARQDSAGTTRPRTSLRSGSSQSSSAFPSTACAGQSSTASAQRRRRSPKPTRELSTVESPSPRASRTTSRTSASPTSRPGEPASSCPATRPSRSARCTPAAASSPATRSRLPRRSCTSWPSGCRGPAARWSRPRTSSPRSAPSSARPSPE